MARKYARKTRRYSRSGGSSRRSYSKRRSSYGNRRSRSSYSRGSIVRIVLQNDMRGETGATPGVVGTVGLSRNPVNGRSKL